MFDPKLQKPEAISDSSEREKAILQEAVEQGGSSEIKEETAEQQEKVVFAPQSAEAVEPTIPAEEKLFSKPEPIVDTPEEIAQHQELTHAKTEEALTLESLINMEGSDIETNAADAMNILINKDLPKA